MIENPELRVYKEEKRVSLELVIPKDVLGAFLVGFGETFAYNEFGAGPCAKKADDYYSHPNGWHVIVSVREKDRERLYAFLEEFCLDRSLIFKNKSRK